MPTRTHLLQASPACVCGSYCGPSYFVMQRPDSNNGIAMFPAAPAIADLVVLDAGFAKFTRQPGISPMRGMCCSHTSVSVSMKHPSRSISLYIPKWDTEYSLTCFLDPMHRCTHGRSTVREHQSDLCLYQRTVSKKFDQLCHCQLPSPRSPA